MDCMDMIIGMAIEDRSRVHDYYTRDRSTPRLDSFYGGLDSLTAAMGWEGDGETRIIFRKKLAGKRRSIGMYDFLTLISVLVCFQHGGGGGGVEVHKVMYMCIYKP